MTIEIWAATPTPFHQDGSLNVDGVSAQRDHLADFGIDGAFVTGTTGEFFALSVDERVAVIDAWAEERTLRISAHVGDLVLENAQMLAERAADKGFDMVASVAPFYGNAPSVDRVVGFLDDVASAAPGVDFCYYHIPGFTGLQYSLREILLEALTRVPTLAAVKFTSPDLLTYSNLREEFPDIKFYFGQDELMPAALALGAQGFIGSLYNTVGPTARRIVELFEAGRVSDAYRMHKILRETATYVGEFGGLGFIKEISGLVSAEAGPARAPWGPISQGGRAAARELVERIRRYNNGEFD